MEESTNVRNTRGSETHGNGDFGAGLVAVVAEVTLLQLFVVVSEPIIALFTILGSLVFGSTLTLVPGCSGADVCRFRVTNVDIVDWKWGGVTNESYWVERTLK